VKHYTAAIQQQCRSQVLLPPPGVRHTFKDYSVLVPPEWTGDIRDQIMAGLKERGVETRAYFYPPVHEQQVFRQYADRPLPQTEGLARRVITLPFFTTITPEEMDYAAAMLAEVERIVA
jgi:dTDP-4-amino-4,6-dideoxygalactose transaminase